MKVTLDTNVLISGTFWSGDSFRILELIDKKKIKCALSEEIIKEYYKIANSDEIIEKKENKKLIISKIVSKVISDSDIVHPKRRINVVKDDPDDNKILECAYAAKVDYIITQDNHLLKLKEFEGIKIINPGDLLKKIIK
ncbi:MAG: PIN domain protein [Candidatus Collierbacteria bacterium GW2011_GWB1_44_6]|uniref:PIN domain protein n=1 Tax=Candidatus Collierbacteria bacterium GW2011_GWB1_44_6 TaxID=1618384 RepID=A0A0G1JJW3_9BACT|nr:MAG: PIN domain protein [Candidatus Collierbacteria bacterium GW2011_GWB1_44_6]